MVKINSKLLNVPIWQWLVLLTVVGMVAFAPAPQINKRVGTGSDPSKLAQLVIPEGGVVLPVTWGSFGKQLVDAGVIDAAKFESIYQSGGGLSDADKELLYGENNGKLQMNRENAHIVLNLLWAFGLANKNPILESGPMNDPQYGGAGAFASTGGWTISTGNSMNHYSMHSLVTLSQDQQALVEKVSKGIYRPCCNNSTYFPDCNHGMAMLGLLEIMASQGVGEDEMYEMALKVNSYWFPDTYLTIASYFASQGTPWNAVDPKEALGFDYSSASGFSDVLAKVEPVSAGGGGSCGV